MLFSIIVFPFVVVLVVSYETSNIEFTHYDNGIQEKNVSICVNKLIFDRQIREHLDLFHQPPGSVRALSTLKTGCLWQLPDSWRVVISVFQY